MRVTNSIVLQEYIFQHFCIGSMVVITNVRLIINDYRRTSILSALALSFNRLRKAIVIVYRGAFQLIFGTFYASTFGCSQILGRKRSMDTLARHWCSGGALDETNLAEING